MLEMHLSFMTVTKRRRNEEDDCSEPAGAFTFFRLSFFLSVFFLLDLTNKEAKGWKEENGRQQEAEMNKPAADMTD